MFADRRRLMMGGAVVLVLALGVWSQMGSTPAVAPAGTAGRGRAPRPETVSAPPEVLKPLKLDALKAARDEPSGTERNPFRFQPRVVAPPPRSVSAAPADTAKPVFSPPPAPSGPPPPPPIPLKFIALVERADGVKWAVLSDGKVTMYGKDGDNIDGRYHIVKIGTESIELTYLDGRGRQVIRLTGQ